MLQTLKLRLLRELVHKNIIYLFAKEQKPQKSQNKQPETKDQQPPKQSQSINPEQATQLAQQAILKHFQNARFRNTFTKDMYRVDLGLIIQRAPIFLTAQDYNLELMRFRFQSFQKYPLTFKFPAEFLEFNISDQTLKVDQQSVDNSATHFRTLENGDKIYYSANSKSAKYSDPNIYDFKSIQHDSTNYVFLIVKSAETGKWEFPAKAVTERETFKDTSQMLMTEMAENVWGIHQLMPQPFLSVDRSFTDTEKRDLQNKGGRGVKTFYFLCSHVQGPIKIASKRYTDYAWVSRLDLNKFFDKEAYNSFVNYLYV